MGIYMSNPSAVISDEMSLEQKLKAIDQMMQEQQNEHKQNNPSAAPLDPADLTICEGCS